MNEPACEEVGCMHEGEPACAEVGCMHEGEGSVQGWDLCI